MHTCVGKVARASMASLVLGLCPCLFYPVLVLFLVSLYPLSGFFWPLTPFYDGHQVILMIENEEMMVDQARFGHFNPGNRKHFPTK